MARRPAPSLRMRVRLGPFLLATRRFTDLAGAKSFAKRWGIPLPAHGGVMLRRLLLVSMVLALGCDNDPPNAPKARVTSYTATTITIEFTNNCIDADRKPENTCNQGVLVTLDDASTGTRFRATNGVVTITDRTPGTVYDLFPYHTDKAAYTYSVPINNWRTAGITGAKIVGLAPTDIVPGNTIIVHGRALSGPAALVDPRPSARATRLPSPGPSRTAWG